MPGEVNTCPVISQDHDRDSESVPATPRQVNKTDSPRDYTQENEGREKNPRIWKTPLSRRLVPTSRVEGRKEKRQFEF